MSLLIALLTLVTAAIHFSFFLEEPVRGLIYGLNALGYVTLLGALYLPLNMLKPWRHVTRWALMAYAGLTILAYLAFGVTRQEWTVPLGPIDKLIEASLIALLWRQD